MKLLVTGIPATRKTTLGDHLRDVHGFYHLDAENAALIQALRDPAGCDRIVARLDALNKPIVITWGFMPGADDDAIRRLQGHGYKLIWFDGNREAARREFIKRGTVPEALLDIQMGRISKMDLAIFNPVIINPFDDQGNILPIDRLAALVMA